MNQAQAQPQQPQPQGTGIATSTVTAGFAGENNTEQTKFILDVNEVIDEINEYLTGQRITVVEDENTGQPKTVWVKFADPIISARGCSELIRELKARLSRVYTTSIKGEEEIYMITKVFARNLIKMLYLKRRKWNIELSNIGLILHGIVDAVKANLDKSKNGAFLNFLKDTSKVIEMRQFGNKPMPTNTKMFNK